MGIEQFKTGIKVHAEQDKKGRLFILAGISGSGKSYIMDLLGKQGVKSIRKITTRPFRQSEITDMNNGKNIDIEAVSKLYNDGDKDDEEQNLKRNDRKKAFLELKLPFAYVNNGNEYYGFDLSEIINYIDNGRDVAIIVNDIPYIKDLKRILGDKCIALLVHRRNEIKLEYFLDLARERGDTDESAKIRYEKAKQDQKALTNNISLFDQIVLNTENGNDERLLEILESFNKRKRINHTNSDTWIPKLYVFIGSPGSGKDEVLNMIKLQGIYHSVIIPKLTDRERRKDDGDELIFPEELGNKNFWQNINPDRYLLYSNFGTKYAIDCKMIEERLKAGVPCSIIVSNRNAIESLEKNFPGQVVSIYMSGLSKEQYEKEHKSELDSLYIKPRLEEYDNTDSLYVGGFFDNIIISTSPDDTKLQLFNIMERYEEDRPMSMSMYADYMKRAKRYAEYILDLQIGG